jgi:hypothetical protein
LKDIEPVFGIVFKGEFNLLMVVSLVVDQELRQALQLGIGGRRVVFQGNFAAPFFGFSLELRDGIGFHESRDNVVSLGAEDEVPVEQKGARQRFGIAREGDSGARLFVQIPEVHGLDNDGRPPLVFRGYRAPEGKGRRDSLIGLRPRRDSRPGA